ncbi:glycerate kinase [Barrientosiimonas humi]|uniref:Glycerate kinase n=1 Tax=Barrientosiimonas humi TaxID=999931 RepID=A0A542XGK9_9MICO|nr:glycerate kinase [Barrientosiimonas humi]TQL34960.1 glycerate kinase [Barrientosiimonas humi]CAG7571152.1 Glycerate 2-kinase [Barrientosiimonas humi]
MRIVVAVDKFKGSLTAAEAAEHLARGLGDGRPDVEVVRVPVADGGDGTLEAALAAGFERVPVRVSGPTGEPVDTAIAVRQGTAVVELAATCGLELLPGGRLEPLTASTLGAGQAIDAAIESGCRTVIFGLGGSASTDAGAGILTALGARLLDASGAEVPLGGAGLDEVATVDLDPALERVRDVDLVLASDVDNPLTGEHGAAAVYGPQKGATEADVARLDAALGRFAGLVRESTGRDVADEPGAGAAGGAGYAAYLLGGTFRQGIELVLELARIDDHLAGADLVITGEGSLDEQSLHGKAPVGVADAAARHGVPVVAVAGRVTVDDDRLRAAGIERAYALTELTDDQEESMTRAGALLETLAPRILADRPETETREQDRR